MVSTESTEKTVRQPNKIPKATIELAGTFAIIVLHLIFKEILSLKYFFFV